MSRSRSVRTAAGARPAHPADRQPVRVAQALKATLEGWQVATAGLVPGHEAPLIDHVVHAPELEAVAVVAWPPSAGGAVLSDHAGATVELAHR